ncbi:MAG: transposase, partial [Deltaproteobacteria bacterium]|nr:transposase [Deltaproteobacteria bacterium]
MDPVMLAGVTLLQFMERVPDRVAAEHAVFHLGWKYALDLELTYGGFHPTVLVYFRDRLEEESVDPNEPAKVKGEPTDNFITEILTTEAAQGEMAGLAEALKRQQNQHEI